MTMHIEPTRTRAPVTKAVIPAAGHGTRFLPATRATPKEMLPIVDTPVLQFVVEEAVAAGCDDVLIITGPGRRSIEDHFDGGSDLEDAQSTVGDEQALVEVRHSADLARLHYVRQGRPLGLGHAVLQAAAHIGDEAFAVLLGDDLIDERDPILPTMLDVRARYGGSVVALTEVEPRLISAYGCAVVGSTLEADVVDLSGLVEKPAADRAPSNLAIIGRYVLDPRVFGVLRSTPPGCGGEFQLTDALRTLSAMSSDHGGGVRGVVFRGRRYDTGDKLSYLKAVVQMAVQRPDVGEEFSAWLREYVVPVDA